MSKLFLSKFPNETEPDSKPKFYIYFTENNAKSYRFLLRKPEIK